MTWKGIKHNPVGEKMKSSEFHDEELHELASGDTLPETASDGDFFFKTDEKRLYIYISD